MEKQINYFTKLCSTLRAYFWSLQFAKNRAATHSANTSSAEFDRIFAKRLTPRSGDVAESKTMAVKGLKSCVVVWKWWIRRPQPGRRTFIPGLARPSLALACQWTKCHIWRRQRGLFGRNDLNGILFSVWGRPFDMRAALFPVKGSSV